MCGLTPYDSGEVLLHGQPVHFTHPAQAMKKKLGYLPEDRQLQGLLLPWEIYQNETLSSLENTGVRRESTEKRNARTGSSCRSGFP